MNKVLIAIILPIFALLGWVLQIEYQHLNSQSIRVAVAGYDPRDLLAGHYINFSLSTGSVNPCSMQGAQEGLPNICLCYEPAPDGIYHQPNWGGLCNEKPQNCKTFIKGSCSYSRFITGIERYSIPEYLAEPLRVLPADSNALVSVTSSGNAQILKLFTKDQPIEEYAKEHYSPR
jgi:uncharacterized membrane-anchored protein